MPAAGALASFAGRPLVHAMASTFRLGLCARHSKISLLLTWPLPLFAACGTPETGGPGPSASDTQTIDTTTAAASSTTSVASSSSSGTTSSTTQTSSAPPSSTSTEAAGTSAATTNAPDTTSTAPAATSEASTETTTASETTNAATTSETPDVPTGSLTVSELTIEANPKMTLSCFVTWTTSEPANSEVQFGVGGYQLHVVDSELVTEHRVHVIGMHPETAYDLKAVSTSETAIGSATGTFTTGKTPATLPAPTPVGDQVDKMQPGWTLTNLHVGGSSNFSTEPAHIVILDEEGLPVWYFIHGTTADQFGMTSTEWLPNGNILIGNASSEPAREIDLEANVLWEGPTGGSPALSHHTSKLSNGNYVVVRESNTTARLEEINPDNDVVWTWDLYDFQQPTTTAADWCHANSVTADAEEKFLYFNCRFQGLFKVDRSDGSLVWQLGAAIDNSSSGTITYLPDNGARFNDAHDPDVYADRVAIFYDNQGWASHEGGENNGTFHSRVVMYQLNEAETEATLIWEFPGSFDVDPGTRTNGKRRFGATPIGSKTATRSSPPACAAQVHTRSSRLPPTVKSCGASSGRKTTVLSRRPRIPALARSTAMNSG